MIARTVADVILFDDIFSDCNSSRQEIQLNGTRLGYPLNYWEGLDAKVNAPWFLLNKLSCGKLLTCHVNIFGVTAVWVVQAVDTFEAALKHLTDAGVELVKFDMGLLSAEGAEVEAELLLAYEAPREIPR